MMKLVPCLLLSITLLANELASSAAFSTLSARLTLLASSRIRPMRLHPTSSIVTNHNRGARGPSMSSDAAAEGGDGEEAAPNEAETKIEGRKKRVILGYKAVLASYLAVGAASISKFGWTFSTARSLAAFLATPAGVSYILIGAADNDRLGSDTYKRLNLALGLNGLLGLGVFTVGGEPPLALPFVLSAINAAKGYAYGALGWDKSADTTLAKDLADALRGMNEGFLFTAPKNVKAFVYWEATALVSSLKLMKLYEIVQYVRANSLAAGLAPLLARFNRLLFFSLVLYTLKDAADRDRLSGTTFIQLNCLAALSMGVNYAFYSGGMPKVVGAVSAAHAAFFAFTGVTSYIKNQYA